MKQYLINNIRQARKKYMPPRIKTLFIAEKPPQSPDRFFYYEDVKQYDSLFIYLMKELYYDNIDLYQISSRATSIKAEILTRFKNDGYYLMDLSDDSSSFAEAYASELMTSLSELVSKGIMSTETPIILIKANVYDCLFSRLVTAGYNVIDERIPFPGSGQQKNFEEHFRNALQQIQSL